MTFKQPPWIEQLPEHVRAVVEAFEAGRIEPVDVPASPVRTESSARLDDIEQMMFKVAAEAPMSPHDAAVLRRQHGAYRFARHIGNDDIPTLKPAIELARDLDDPGQIRLRVALELLSPDDRGPVLH